MRSQRETAAIFSASVLVLAWGAARPGIATAYVDPVAKIQAQDEAVYASTSFAMAAHGDWMTPRFLGRYALYKPPVLYWLSAACVKVLGRNAIALRVASILAGAATVTLVFCWFRTTAALTGAVLLLSSHMFFVLSRIGLTDALLTFEMTAAMYALARDPRLEKRGSLLAFSLASGTAIMTKALAGVFPLIALAILCIFSKEKPRWIRLAQVIGITAAVALPWHLWQLYQHPRWFWSEYVLTEQVTWGLGPPLQTTGEAAAAYYLERLLLLDPVLLLAALIGLVRAPSRVPVVWAGIVLACALAFQYRNASYLMPMFPAMAVLAAGAIPKPHARIALGVAVGLFVIKALAPTATWGLPFGPESVNPSHAALDAYAALHRGNELIVIDPDDQFYSADLGLPKVRYCYLDPRTQRPKSPLDFEYLGITVTAADFNRLQELMPVFAQRVREWNLDSTEPVATVILARNEQEIAELIRSHTESDFYAPVGAGARVFQLSSVVIQRP